MISNSARDGFNHLLNQAIRSSISQDEMCDMSVMGDLARIEGEKIVIFTIASLLFRATLIIYFKPDEHAKSFFARVNKISPAEMTEQTLVDAIAEYGNMCCGTLNRSLNQFFPNIGMSTPNFIDRRCSGFLNALDCSHIAHIQVNTNNDYRFHVSLGVSAYADLDFRVLPGQENDKVGELELF